MKAVLQRMLARRPLLYLRVLQAFGMGSAEKRMFLALLREGDVILDIGANRGQYTRLFSDIAGPRGAVHAFEPVPSTFAMLTSAMEAAQGHANFTLNNFALGDAEGAAVLHLPGEDDGQASMRRHEVGSWAGGVAVKSSECRVKTLDGYAAGFQRLDFIKCDVEGAELLVIKGAAKTLNRLSPILFLEANPAWTKSFGYTPGDLVRELRKFGYDKIFVAGEKAVPFSETEITGSVNLLCAKAELHAQRLRALERV